MAKDSFVGDQVMKGSTFAKNLDTTHNTNPGLTSHNDVKVKGIRKRKDRSHSISGKDKKVVRSNSEERIIKKNICNKNIRRVSSHEDFKKVSNSENIEILKENSSSNTMKCDAVNSSHIDEFEWKRSGERQFRLPLYRRKHNYLRRSPKLRPVITTYYEDKTVNVNNNNNEDDCVNIKQVNIKLTQQSNNLTDKKECSSPYESPSSSVLDLSTLHKQIDCLEPIPSSTNRHVTEYIDTLPSTSVACNKLISSPRNSIIVTERIYLDHYVAQSKGSPLKSALNPIEKRLNYLSKQIKRAKKKIKQFEQEFEKKKGYKPSEMDKLNDVYVNSIMIDLYKLKKEYKQTKKQEKIQPGGNMLFFEELEVQENAPDSLGETLTEIEQRLTSKRTLVGRPLSIEEMTNAQLLDEKVDIQKGLLQLQTKHGRPSSKDDKDLVRPLYDRYRNIKRIIARSSLPNSNIIELATIHEHETLHIPINQSQTSTPEAENIPEIQNVEDTESLSIEKSLHALSLDELIEEKRCTIEEKKKLQKSLKEFENNFRVKVGRKLQKDDKEPMNFVYDSYKKAKSKLKLLDALLKKSTSQFSHIT